MNPSSNSLPTPELAIDSTIKVWYCFISLFNAYLKDGNAMQAQELRDRIISFLGEFPPSEPFVCTAAMLNDQEILFMCHWGGYDIESGRYWRGIDNEEREGWVLGVSMDPPEVDRLKMEKGESNFFRWDFDVTPDDEVNHWLWIEDHDTLEVEDILLATGEEAIAKLRWILENCQPKTV